MGANSRVKAQRRFERLARQRVTRGSSQLYVGGSASAGFLSEPLVVGVETRPITRLGDPPTITPERRTAEGVPAAVPGVRFLQAACPSCCFLAQRVHWSLPKRCSVSAQVILLLQRRAVERCGSSVRRVARASRAT